MIGLDAKNFLNDILEITYICLAESINLGHYRQRHAMIPEAEAKIN